VRRKVLWFLAIGIVLLAGTAGTLFWASKQVPDFYAEAMAAEIAPAVRQEAAKEFVQRTLRIVEDVEHSDRWAEEFTQEQINSWLIEELHQNYPELVPEGVTDPRVGLHDGVISLGFQYDGEAWAGVVSIRVRPWVPEPNRLAIEVLSIRAGLVPMPLDELLHEVAREVETEGLPISWTQRNGNDVAIVRLDADPDGPVLERLEVLQGRIRASGKGRGMSPEERKFLQAMGTGSVRR
jgi:hypothetical protein